MLTQRQKRLTRRDGDRRGLELSALPLSRAAPDLTRARLIKFLGAYRPHFPLLLADLVCAVIVSMTALFLPLCANYVTKHLVNLGASPGALDQIYAVGVVMLALLAVQALSTLFVDYQGHVMGAKMEGSMRQELGRASCRERVLRLV